VRLDVTVTATQTWIDDAGNTHQGWAPLTKVEVAYMKRRRDPSRPRVIRIVDNGSEEWHVIDPSARRREIEAMTDAEILAAAGDHVHGDAAALAKELRAYAARSPAHAREVFLPGRWHERSAPAATPSDRAATLAPAAAPPDRAPATLGERQAS
jgi:hypothetical protein